MIAKPNRILAAAALAWLGLPPSAAAQTGAVSPPTGAVNPPTGAGRPVGLAQPSVSTIQDGTITFQGAVGGGVISTGSGPIFFPVPAVHLHGHGGFHLGFGRLGHGRFGPYHDNYLYPNILNPYPSPPIQFGHVSGPAYTGADLAPGTADLMTKAGLSLGMGKAEKAREMALEAINSGSGARAQRVLALALAGERRYEEAAAVLRSALSDPAVAGSAPPEMFVTDASRGGAIADGASRHARLTDSASAWLLAIDVARATGTRYNATRWIEAAEEAGLPPDIAEALREAAGI